jgi:glycosyltransferase involved in cell wall biosynthesis
MVRNQAVTLHDLSPLEHPEWFRKGFALWYRLLLPILVKRVAVIFTPSAYVQQKIRDRFSVRSVLVTPNGIDTSHFHPGAQQATYVCPEKFILFVGSLQPRKNLQALLRVWHQLKDEYPHLWLVVAGEAGVIFSKIKYHPDERVLFLGHVAEDDLPGLYANALLLVLPSFDEGFGLPALEAMACGTPVIVSDAGALPETVGNASLILNISESEGLIKAIKECLENSALRSTLIENGYQRIKNFSWQRSAELIWKTLNEI